jgi:RimJ/RimL family protein N-acetyltransferase
MAMIYELPRALFGRARDLFAETWMDGAFIWGAFEGRLTGRVFVDDPERPTAAMLTQAFEYYVAGDPGATALRRFIADAPAEAEVFDKMYGYVATNVPFARALLDDHAGRLRVIARRGYRWTGDDAAATALARWQDTPPGITLRPLDRTLAERVDREMGQSIAPFWGGYDRFLSGGFGFCALAGETLAAVAYAAGVGGGEANIDVFTAEAFRRQGLAARVCAAFVTHCRAHDMVATWDCDADNNASARLATALGFREGLPFSQLSTPGYSKLMESRGRWARERTTAEGLTPYRQTNHA